MKIKEVAVMIGGVVDGDGDTDVRGLSGLDGVKPGDLTFAMNDELLSLAEKSPAACVLTSRDIRKSTKPLIRVENPKMAFLMIYNALNKPQTRAAFRDPSATISPSAKIGKDVWIGAGVRIGDEVIIGDNTAIEANSVIMKKASVGSNCHIYSNVTLYESVILKDRIIIHAGVVLGADGFGYVRDKDKLYKFPQLGKVIIESDVEIGANTTIDRGSLGDTVVGAGTKIDNLCQIAHNVKIGRNGVMAAQCGVSGSVTIKDNITIAGQVGFSDNITVGNNVMVGGQSGVLEDVKDGGIVWGMPAKSIVRMKRQIIVMNWLTDNFGRIKKFLGEKD